MLVPLYFACTYTASCTPQTSEAEVTGSTKKGPHAHVLSCLTAIPRFNTFAIPHPHPHPRPRSSFFLFLFPLHRLLATLQIPSSFCLLGSILGSRLFSLQLAISSLSRISQSPPSVVAAFDLLYIITSLSPSLLFALFHPSISSIFSLITTTHRRIPTAHSCIGPSLTHTPPWRQDHSSPWTT